MKSSATPRGAEMACDGINTLARSRFGGEPSSTTYPANLNPHPLVHILGVSVG